MKKDPLVFKAISSIMGCLLALGILELALRFHDPFRFRVRSDRVVLPANQKYNYKTAGGKLDPVVIHSKNALGFRGPDRPADFSKRTTIIVSGGSTTECFWLSDGNDWPAVLGQELAAHSDRTWVNNAGLDGFSTFGMLVLLKDHIVPIKPDYLLLSVGINDMACEKPWDFELEKLNSLSLGSAKMFLKTAANNSHLLSMSLNFLRAYRAKSLEAGHKQVDFHAREDAPSPGPSKEELISLHARFLAEYRFRVLSLIDTARRNHIEPVLITQPAVYGFAIDPETGKDMSRIQVNEMSARALVPVSALSGRVARESLELYNEITRQCGKERDIQVIDLAEKMPLNTKYYYDFVHFTNAGARLAGKIIFQELSRRL